MVEAASVETLATHPSATAEEDFSDPIFQMMVRSDPGAWWENCVLIEDKRKMLVKPRDLGGSNPLQQQLDELLIYCRKNRLPMRAVILKPRQRGVSTKSVAVALWAQKVQPRDGLIVGGKDWQVNNLWKIYKRYAETDEFPWGFTGTVMDSKAEWANGSSMKRQTAGGKDPGRSGTFQVLIGTEVAYWGRDESVKNAASVLTGLLACMPNETVDPDTIAILESTSAGGSGLFYRRWEDGIDLADFLRGERKPGAFVRIFAGWHEFSDTVLPVKDAAEGRAILAGVGARNPAEAAREREMRVRYGLTAAQIKWWRSILAECDNDPDKRDREYPTTPEDAFRAAQPCRFNLTHLRLMGDEARNVAGQLSFGMLDQPDAEKEAYTWRPVQDPKEGNFVVLEPPIVGHRYLISVDNAGGRARGEDKKDTDCHAVTVLRDGYFDTRTGSWRPPAVVAAINPHANGEKGQRVDIDILAEWVWRLHCFYGRCLVAPEANNDRGVILLLRNRGCLLYEQTKAATTKEQSKPSGKLGFWTRGGENEGTRRFIIENLARAVREHGRDGEGVFIPFTWIIDELMHFVTDPDSGKDEAMEGWHDDWVLALAIGLHLVRGGTVYQPPRDELPLPRDLRLTEERERRHHQGGDAI